MGLRRSIGLVTALACMLALWACSRQQQDEAGGPLLSPLSFSADMGATRVSLEGPSPVWSEDDAISIFGAAGSNARFSVSSCSGTKALFTGTGDASGPYRAVYPYSASNALSGSELRLELPALQTVSAEGADPRALIMTASAQAGEVLMFRNLGSVVRFSITDPGISSVTFCALDGTLLAGCIAVDASRESRVLTGSPSIELRPASGTFAPGTYCIPFHASSPHGIALLFTRAADSKVALKSTSKTLDAGRSSIMDLGSVCGSLSWEDATLIRSASELKAWAAGSRSANEKVYLLADVDLGGASLSPVSGFSGSFDGLGHCVTGFSIPAGQRAAGIFGPVSGSVRNVFFGSSRADACSTPMLCANNVVAHRGGSTEAGSSKYPENSLAALRYSISLGCLACECDIYWTADDRVVVAHATSTYTINGLKPWEHTLDELRAAGKLSNGETLPALEDYIDLVMKESRCTRLMLDIKNVGTASYAVSAARRACEIITEKKARNWCMFICTSASGVMPSANSCAKAAGVEIAWMSNSSASTYKSKGYTWANLNAVSAMSAASGGTGSRTLEEFEAAGVELSVFAVDRKSGYSSAVYSESAIAYYLANASRFKAITTNYPKWLVNSLVD